MEDKRKNKKIYFYEVTNPRVAERIISLNRYQYFVEDKPHWKTGEMTKTYFFEYINGIKEDAKKIKDELYKKADNRNGFEKDV